MQITGSLKNHQHPELSVVRTGDFSLNNSTSLKFPDGTLICIHNIEKTDLRTGTSGRFDWKTPFKDKPVVFVNITQNETNYGAYSGEIQINQKLSTNKTCIYRDIEYWDNHQGKMIISFMGIGRWK